MTTRLVTAAGVLVSAAVHLWLWYDGFRDIAWIGPLFMLNAIAGALIAALVVWWRSWFSALLALGFGASTLVAFLLSATVGLFGVHEIFLGTWQIVAAVAEVVSIIGGLVLLLRQRRAGRSGLEPQDRVTVRRANLH